MAVVLYSNTVVHSEVSKNLDDVYKSSATLFLSDLSLVLDEVEEHYDDIGTEYRYGSSTNKISLSNYIKNSR